MKTAIDELGDKLGDMLSSREAFTKSIDKTALKDYINSLLVQQRNLYSSLQNLTEPNVAKRLSVLIGKHRGDKKLAGLQGYLMFRGKLRKDAATVENQTPLQSLANTVRTFIDILEELDGKIDVIFQGKEVNLFNTRLSHVLVIGVMVESNTLYNFTKYLISALLTDLNPASLKTLAKYRYMYIGEKAQDVSTIVNRSSMKTGAYNFDAMIKDMKTKSVDVTLLDDFNNITVGNVNSAKVNANAKGLIKRGAMALDFFRWIGEVWETYKHSKAVKAKTEKEWMEAHVALLILDLDGMDPNSSEYKRLAKIIQKYEDMINAEDKKIQKYEEQFA